MIIKKEQKILNLHNFIINITGSNNATLNLLQNTFSHQNRANDVFIKSNSKRSFLDSAVPGGKTVTGFTNSEEAAVQLTKIVPFLLEDELKKRGADYKNTADWTPFAVQDGLMITGQNPASSELVAEKLLAQLAK